MSEPISIRRAFAGKHVLLTGASGFVGKVWLTLMLDRVPEIGRIYVLLRSKALLSARERFEKMVNTSPAFRPLHERLGPAFSSFLADKIEVIEGELGADDLGLEPAVLGRLRRDVDLVVHCAGLVDFNPDLRKALSTNVEGTLRVADFVESSERAALLHISTCYVAGRRSGMIPERAHAEYSPLGDEIDAAAELRAAFTACEELCARHESQQHAEAVRTEVAAMVRGRRTGDRARLIANLARRRLREEQKQALVDEGMARAQRLGWPNTYTFSKSLAESLLLRRKGLRLAILRPSIVESALEYPFPGWNESFNGSAPLAYVMGSWFRMVPAKPDAPFDVIPVDEVCKAMSIAGAALLLGRHSPVYHVGSSDLHRCSVGRAAELIVLAHRRHFRQLGNERNERIFKSRWDAVLVEPDTVFGVGRNRALLDGVREAIALLPDKIERKAKRVRDRVDRADKKLAQIEEMIRLYLPFMYESFYVFEARALPGMPALEPELRFAPERIDWRKYWIEVHVPGLRRWAFPLIEGKRPERYRPDHPVRLPPAQPATRVPVAEASLEMSADAASAED